MQDPLQGKEPKPFISIYWRCCHLFSRVYRDKLATCYEGKCPGCRRQLKVAIGAQGTKGRMFIAE